MTQYTAFLVLAPIACLIVAGILAFAWRGRASREFSALLFLMLAVEGWLVCNTLELTAGTEAWTLFWAKVTYVFVAATPVVWLAFMVQYTGADRWLRSPVYWVSALVPCVTVLLVWTNEGHHLIWQQVEFVPVQRFLAIHVAYGPWFWVHTVQSYVLVLAGALLVLHSYLGASPVYRQQSRWLVWGGLIPVLWNMIYVLRVIPGLRKDYTPVALALAGLCFAIGMARDRLFDLRPMARGRVFETMRDAVIVVDAGGRLVDANPAAKDLLSELRPRDAVIGVTFEESVGHCIPEVLGVWPALVEYVARATPDSGRAAPDSVDLVWPLEGRKQVFEGRVLTLKKNGERPAGELIVLHDVTERYENEQALRHHLAELMVTNEQLDTFADTVAHDLRSPLGTLIGFADTLRLGLTDMPVEDVREQLGMMLQSGLTMARTVDSLLLLARVHRQEDLVCEAVDMGYVVHEALLQLRREMLDVAIAVTSPDEWPWVVGYSPWLIEVWNNYLTNGVKYGGTPPELTLGFDMEPEYPSADDSVGHESPSMVRFWVRDNGPGLTEEQIEQLFVPFGRLEPGRAVGHGLGLWIVRRIISRLGGQVGAFSQPGCGSTFWFTLPSRETLGAGLE